MRKENIGLNFGFCPQGVYDLIWEKLRIAVAKNLGFGLNKTASVMLSTMPNSKNSINGSYNYKTI